MRKCVSIVIMMVTIFFLLTSSVAAERITLIGEVNDNYQIVTDNEIYEVKNNAAGDDLVLNYIAQKVKVVGQVKETDDYKIITVESFEVVDE